MIEYILLKTVYNKIGQAQKTDEPQKPQEMQKMQGTGPNEPFFAGEKAKDPAGDAKGTMGTMSVVMACIFFLVWLGLGVWAVTLSWSSNSMVGWGALPKVFFAIVAFLFNQSYLLTHLIWKLDLIWYIRSLEEASGGVELSE